MHTDGQADRWQVQRQRLPERAPTHGHHSPDLTDILLSHLHMDDDGVDLTAYQLPHSPCTQLQQTVLLFRQRQTDSLLLGPPFPAVPTLPPPPRTKSCFIINKEPKETGDPDSGERWGRPGPSGPGSLLSSPSATPLHLQPAGRAMETQE